MIDPTVKKVSQAAGYKNRCASAFSTLGNRLKRNPSEECCKCLFKNIFHFLTNIITTGRKATGKRLFAEEGEGLDQHRQSAGLHQ